MTANNFPYRLYLVTNDTACLGRNMFQIVEAAIKGGVDLVQIREKNLTTQAFLLKALKMKELLDKYNVPLIVNDNLEVAMACNAAGMHVGNSDISPVEIRKVWPACNLIGYSIEAETHLQNEAAAAADHFGISPVFGTKTKIDTIIEWGLAGVRKIRSATTKPLVAIGNINAANAADLIMAGADCLAVVSAICSAANPAKAAEEIRNEIEKHIYVNL
jgi:thiamine-phosphate pyrophosphorylase